MIEYIISIIIGIVFGLLFGWWIAKMRQKRYVKRLIRNSDLTPEQIAKQKQEDEAFWKMKKEVQNGRKDKYRVKRNFEYTESSTGKSTTEGNNSSIRDNTSSSQRESVQNIDVEQPEQDSNTIELYFPANL